MIRFGEEPIQASLKGKRLDEFVSTRLMYETGSTKYDREMAINCLVPLDHPTQYPVNRKIWTQQSTKECTQICGILKIGIFALRLKKGKKQFVFSNKLVKFSGDAQIHRQGKVRVRRKVEF